MVPGAIVKAAMEAIQELSVSVTFIELSAVSNCGKSIAEYPKVKPPTNVASVPTNDAQNYNFQD